MAILIVLLGAAIIGPMVAPYDPSAQEVANRLASPSLDHLLGTDALGRDVLSRLLHGGRYSLLAAVGVGAMVLVVGVAIGLCSGLLGGWVDGILMRTVDVLLAFPNFLLVLAVIGAFGPGVINLMAALVVVWWAGYARLVRGLVLSTRKHAYVDSARALGASPRRVAMRHVLPSVVGPVVVLWTLQSGRLLLALAALSFLGMGVQPPTPEWGAMLNEARDNMARAPQLMVYPGLLITFAALGFNLLGDGLRDALDPRLR